jgi:hypothetical protein
MYTSKTKLGYHLTIANSIVIEESGAKCWCRPLHSTRCLSVMDIGHIGFTCTKAAACRSLITVAEEQSPRQSC